MKRYANPTSIIPDKPDEAPNESFDVVLLQDKLKEALRRDVTNLVAESTRGKLKSESAKDLVNYLKVLKELEEEEVKKLKGMTPEQLAAVKASV